MRWLSAAEQRAWIGLLVSVSGLGYAADEQLRRDAGISFQTYAILAALSDGLDSSLHMTELAGITGHSQSRLSHAVARLERDGFVRRSSCPRDKRAVHATLTPQGRELIRSAAPGHVTAVRELVFDRLSSDQTHALGEITGILYDALIEAGFAPPISAFNRGQAPNGQ